MSSQAQLLPTLFALLPADQLDLILSRISLQALHVEPYHIRDDVFLTTHPVVPGQLRSLRMRARRRRRGRGGAGSGGSLPTAASTGAGQGHATATAAPGTASDAIETWEYSLAWVSPPLSGREYSEMRVQAYIGLDVVGMSSRDEIENFVVALGCQHSHTHSRLGHLFHLPTPAQGISSTLHLSVTRVLEQGAKPADHAAEPYLVQLQPGRPVGAVASRGEMSLQDTMRIMLDVAGRIDGLEWETGRA